MFTERTQMYDKFDRILPVAKVIYNPKEFWVYRAAPP